jgi:hypothetical protein
MTNQKSNKELVAAGHAFAIAQGADAPLKEIAKLVSDLATRLDVMTVRADVLAVENMKLKSGAGFFFYGSEYGFETFKSAKEASDAAQSAIDDYLGDACDGWSEEVETVCWGVVMQQATKNNERPRGDEDTHLGEHIESICDYDLLPTMATLIADESNDCDKQQLSALPVERDKYGYWTHPVYENFCDGRENIAADEFNEWLKQQGLRCFIQYRDEEEIDPNVDGYDISSWQPEAPAGEGWFVASIHDTEDGAVCIWLRAAKDGE